MVLAIKASRFPEKQRIRRGIVLPSPGGETRVPGAAQARHRGSEGGPRCKASWWMRSCTIRMILFVSRKTIRETIDKRQREAIFCLPLLNGEGRTFVRPLLTCARETVKLVEDKKRNPAICSLCASNYGFTARVAIKQGIFKSCRRPSPLVSS